MSQFPAGSYVKSKNGYYFRKVLKNDGVLIFLSWSWKEGVAQNRDENGLRECDKYYNIYTLTEIGANYVPATAQEAGFEEEGRWRPEVGSTYWYADRYKTWQGTWRNGREDWFCFNTDNCFRTEEEADEYRKRVSRPL